MSGFPAPETSLNVIVVADAAPIIDETPTINPAKALFMHNSMLYRHAAQPPRRTPSQQSGDISILCRLGFPQLSEKASRMPVSALSAAWDQHREHGC
jgi:hypothetical protein